jgi:hypothetical protein
MSSQPTSFLANFLSWTRILLRAKRSYLNPSLRWTKKYRMPPRVVGANSSQRILVATSFAGNLGALTMESVVAAALRVRGAQVSALLCDSVLPTCMECEHRLYPTSPAQQRLLRDGPKELCFSCSRNGTSLYGDLAVPVLYYSEYITHQDHQLALEISRATPFEDIGSYKLDGLLVGEQAYAGVLRFYSRGDTSSEPHAEGLVRRYFEAALLTVFMMRNLLNKHPIDVCVLNHGIYVPQGLIAEVCRERGIRVVTWNPAYRRNCFIFSHHDTYHHTLMSEPQSTWEDMRWSEEMEREIMEYIDSRSEGTRDWIWFHEKPEFDIRRIESELGIDFSRPTIGLLTNVVWDAQLHYPANAFPSMVDWVLDTISWFSAHPRLQLVIRVHPAEIRGTVPSRQRIMDEIFTRFQNLPSNIFIISPESSASTYAVMKKCDSVIIYGTKTGVELASMGIPVIVAGEAWVRNKGVTHDASSVDKYHEFLVNLPFGRRMPPHQIQRARKYAYHFFFRRMIPLPFMHPCKGVPPFKPELNTLDQLYPGNFKGLDVICDGILTGSEFVYPAEDDNKQAMQDLRI